MNRCIDDLKKHCSGVRGGPFGIEVAAEDFGEDRTAFSGRYHTCSLRKEDVSTHATLKSPNRYTKRDRRQG